MTSVSPIRDVDTQVDCDAAVTTSISPKIRVVAPLVRVCSTEADATSPYRGNKFLLSHMLKAANTQQERRRPV